MPVVEKYVKQCRIIAQTIGLSTALVGVIIVLLRCFQILSPEEQDLQSISMSTDTALAMGLTGFLLFLNAKQPPVSSKLQTWLKILALFIIMIPIIDIGLIWNKRFVNFFGKESSDLMEVIFMNPMAWRYVFTVPLLGLALFLIDAESKNGFHPAKIFSILSFYSFLIPIYRYIHHRILDQPVFLSFVYKDIPTAYFFAALSIGIAIARPKEGALLIINGTGVAGNLARLLIPFVILLPPFLFLITDFAVSFNLYWDTAIIAAINSLVLLTLILNYTFSLSRTELDYEKTLERNVVLRQQQKETSKECNRLQQVSDFKSELTSVVSHEIKTPLSVIKETLSLILDELEGPITSAQREILSLSQSNIDRLVRLVNNVLSLARLESQTILLCFENIEFNNLINKVCNFMGPEMHKKNITFNYSVLTKDVSICCDGDKIEQILINLLHNAYKFTPMGGFITLQCELFQNQVRVSVQDTGPGIKPEDQSKIFDLYRLAHDQGEARKQDGTGIGLAVCKKFAELHGGEIVVVSTPGQGANFILTLPIRPVFRITSDS